MERIGETADCKSLRLFLWNEKLTRNQISESEGLCVFIINSTFMTLQPCKCGYHNTIEHTKCSTVIPFDLSKLLNRDASLVPMLVSATLQFLPQTIKHLADDISYCLFTEFEHSQASLPPPSRPNYVIAIEISQTRCVGFTGTADSPNFTEIPPPVPFYRWFQKEDEEEEEELFIVRNVTAADYRNDPYIHYTTDVLEYLDTLRAYTGEGGIFPTNPPIAADVPRGFFEVQPCSTPIDDLFINQTVKDLMDETCPVCYEDLKDENEVIATYCSHAFHTRCLLPWLSKKNTCPTCRAVYPLHYSPFFDRQGHKRKPNKLEANV